MGTMIDISAVEAELEAMTAFTNLEYSGFGWARWEKRGDDNVLVVYRVRVLDIGSPGYTEINLDPAQIAQFMTEPDFPNLKVWFHAHPILSWSSTDENTCRNEPLGGSPELAKWTASIVRTPKGWIGRIDTYGPKGRTEHVPVIPNVSVGIIEQIQEIDARKAPKLRQVPLFGRPLMSSQVQRDFSYDDWPEAAGNVEMIEDGMCPECESEEVYAIPGFADLECGECGSQFSRAEMLAYIRRISEDEIESVVPTWSLFGFLGKRGSKHG